MSNIIAAGGRFYTFWERPDSPVGSYMDGQAKLQRTFDVGWKRNTADPNDIGTYSHSWLFARAMLGFSEEYPNGLGGDYVARSLPWGMYFVAEHSVDHRTKGDYWLYPTGVESIRGIGVRETVEEFDREPTYEYARVSFCYETLPYHLYDDEEMMERGWTIDTAPDEGMLRRYVSRCIQPSSDYLSLPFGIHKWVSDETQFTNSAGTIVPSAEIIYTWHNVPSLPTHIFKYIGCVNKNPFDQFDYVSKGRFAPQTLLLTGIELKPFRQILSSVVSYNITYKMKYFSALAPMTLTQDPLDNHPWQEGEEYASAGYGFARGHNHFIRYVIKPTSDPPKYFYDHLTSDGTPTGAPVYKLKEFRNLFRLYEANVINEKGDNWATYPAYE